MTLGFSDRSRSGVRFRFLLSLALILLSPFSFRYSLVAQEESPAVYDLTMESMVELIMDNSFTIRRLRLELERDRHNLKAERSRMKSSVDLEVTLPAFRMTSEPKWNSTLQRNEIVQENTRRWEGELSIRQPVILFGYPTNGYLSINNRMYRYDQVDDDGTKDTNYYNRYYISYSQPLFQPNTLKNALEQAELNLEETQLDFYDDVVDIVASVSDGYHSLFGQYYERTIREETIRDIERALALAERLAGSDSTRAVDIEQIQIELANAQEDLQRTESSIRTFVSFLKRELGLAEADSVSFEPVFQLDPVPVDMDVAGRYALDLTPRMRQMDIDLRNQEIRLDRTKSRGGFRMNLNMSYGRERLDDVFTHIWREPDQSYTLTISTYLPIWDWGERKARIASSRIGIEQTRLRIEETRLGIISGVRNEVLNVQDRESRTMAMQENLELARNITETSFQRYGDGVITALDLLLSIRRESDTAGNFLQAYLSWKGSLSDLQRQTFFSFERDQPLLEWFRTEGWVPENGLEGFGRGT